MGRSRVEEQLAALHALRSEAAGVEATRTLRRAIRSKTGLIAAAAAEIVGELALDELADELPAAFERFLENPVKRDPQCRAKCAVARTLIELGRWEDEVFARGIRHVQREPVWGGSEDSAAELRGLCALAYAQLGHPEAVLAIADLLADAERAARLAAARALGDSGRLDAVPLLRFKARIGDEDAEVLGAVFGSLLHLDPESSFELVASYLEDTSDLVAEAAALALGESRSEAALAPLSAWCDAAVTSERRQVAHLALALLRLEAAERTLLRTIRESPAADATSAVRALATFAHDTELGARVRAAAAENPEGEVLAAAERAFG